MHQLRRTGRDRPQNVRQPAWFWAQAVRACPQQHHEKLACAGGVDAQLWEVCPKWTLADTQNGPCRGRGCRWGGKGAPPGVSLSTFEPRGLCAPSRFSLRRKLFPPVPQVKKELGGSLMPGPQVSAASPCHLPQGSETGRPRGRWGYRALGQGSRLLPRSQG